MYHLPCPVSKYWNLCKICDYCRVAAISRWCVHICHVYSRRPHILFPHRNILLDVRRRWEKFISRSCDDLTHNQQLHVWDTAFLPFSDEILFYISFKIKKLFLYLSLSLIDDYVTFHHPLKIFICTVNETAKLFELEFFQIIS